MAAMSTTTTTIPCAPSGTRARRRALGWDLFACGRDIAKILTRAVRMAIRIIRAIPVDAFPTRRSRRGWRAVGARRPSRVALRRVANDPIGRRRRRHPGVFGNEAQARALLPAGTYLIVTAYNPMGARADPRRLNGAAARALAASVRDMRPSPRRCFPRCPWTPSGVSTWNEPGMAVQLPIETDAQARRR